VRTSLSRALTWAGCILRESSVLSGTGWPALGVELPPCTRACGSTCPSWLHCSTPYKRVRWLCAGGACVIRWFHTYREQRQLRGQARCSKARSRSGVRLCWMRRHAMPLATRRHAMPPTTRSKSYQCPRSGSGRGIRPQCGRGLRYGCADEPVEIRRGIGGALQIGELPGVLCNRTE
jgi:hypothetical protein